MSDSNSRTISSGSARKGIFGRITLPKLSGNEAADSFKKKINQFSDATRSMGTTIQGAFGNGKKESNPYSKGIGELDDYGYEKYNIAEDTEIFISKVPERALFNEGEPMMMRASSGAFIGSNEVVPEAPVDTSDVVAESKQSIARLFSNVEVGPGNDGTIAGFTGPVIDGRVEVESRSEIDNAFLNKVSRPSVSYPKGDVVGDVAAEDPEPIVPSEVPVEEDDSWMYRDDDEAQAILEMHRDSIDAIVDGSSMGSTSIMCREVPIAEPVPEVDAQVQPTEEVPVEAPVSIETAEEVPVDEVQPTEEIQAVADVPVEEAPVETMVAKPALPTIDIPNDGVFTEAATEPETTVSTDEAATVLNAEAAATSAAVEVPEAPARILPSNLDEDGSSCLAPIADPVRRRPKTRTYRFGKNGVLQNVDSEKKEESAEGLRGPFDVTVGETVARVETEESEPVTTVPPVELSDEVADVMRLVLPELDLDEDSSTVPFDDVQIPADGMESICFERIADDPVDATGEEVATMQLPEPPVAAEVPVSHAPEQGAAPIHETQAPVDGPGSPVTDAPSHGVVFSFGTGGTAMGGSMVCFSF
ncbi:MAG: hypothetical protein IJ026_07510 [Candidatus Methanomethylophilaceae archaeon]|nr:hypothetical protein [Candidatus Methanomethylophilaceae archaeon]